MQTWKQTAKNFIAEAETMKCIELIEANGVAVGSLKDDALRLEAEGDTHTGPDSMWPDGRFGEWFNECTSIWKQLIELIDSAN